MHHWNVIDSIVDQMKNNSDRIDIRSDSIDTILARKGGEEKWNHNFHIVKSETSLKQNTICKFKSDTEKSDTTNGWRGKRE